MANDNQALTLIGGANKPWIERLSEREVVDAMKQTIARGASDAQFLIFIEVAKASNLNPFLKEIWWIPANGGQVTIAEDGWQKIANACPLYKGHETFYDYEGGMRSDHPLEGKRLIGCEVRIHREDRAFSHCGYALFSEYGKTPQESAAWKYKHKMLQNRAFTIAAREAFNASGIYSEDELPETTAAEVISTEPHSQAGEMRNRFGVGGNGNGQASSATRLQNDSKVEIAKDILTAEQEIAQRMALLFEEDKEAARAWLLEVTNNRVKGQTSLVKNPDLIPIVLERVREKCCEEGKYLPGEEQPSDPAPQLPEPSQDADGLNDAQGEMLEEINGVLLQLAGADPRKRAYYMRNWTDHKCGMLTELRNHPELLDMVLDRARISLDEAAQAAAQATSQK